MPAWMSFAVISVFISPKKKPVWASLMPEKLIMLSFSLHRMEAFLYVNLFE